MAADKRVQIIEAATRLFAEKGFHATSIQEIADAAGTAKGSVYLYFKSKDALLLTIYQSFLERIYREIRGSGMELPVSRERFSVQLRVQLEQFLEFRDFIKMQLQEQHLHQNEDIQKVIMQTQVKSFVWLYESIVEVYGEEFRPWAVDCAQLFQGMLNSYLGMMILYNRSFPLEELVANLVDRLEDLAEGYLRRKPKPLTSQETFEELMCAIAPQVVGPASMEQRKERFKEQLHLTLEAVKALPLEKEISEDLYASLQVLEEELEKPEPKRVVVQGMLTVLKQTGREELLKPLEQLQAAAMAVLGAGATSTGPASSA